MIITRAQYNTKNLEELPILNINSTRLEWKTTRVHSKTLEMQT